MLPDILMRKLDDKDVFVVHKEVYALTALYALTLRRDLADSCHLFRPCEMP